MKAQEGGRKIIFMLLILVLIVAEGCTRYGSVRLEGEEGAVGVEVENYPNDGYDRYGGSRGINTGGFEGRPGRGEGAGYNVPAGHLPPPGQCRIWYPDRPAGHQPPPGDCYDLEGRVPRGAILVR